MSLDMIKVRCSKESDPTLFIIEISHLLGFGLTVFYTVKVTYTKLMSRTLVIKETDFVH